MRDDQWDLERLLGVGNAIEARPELMVEKVAELLSVRKRDGTVVHLEANPVQIAFERARGQRNIVLKARQMGVTTWVAARFFLKTITTCGVMTVQVAHTQDAAEGIFRIVQRFWECLPEKLRKGPLKRS